MTRRALWIVVAALLTTAIASARQMPDPKHMSGMPLPVSDIPVGTVTVRLIRGQLTNPLPGETVQLTGQGMTPRTAKSDESGRTQFTGLAPGTRVKASATINGETLQSQEFDVQSTGGIRLMLVATDGAAAKPAEEGGKVADSSAVPAPSSSGTKAASSSRLARMD